MSRNNGQGRSPKEHIPWLGVIILAGIVSNILEGLIGLTMSLVPLAIGAYIIVQIVHAFSGRKNEETNREDAHRRDVEDYVRTHLNNQAGSSASSDSGRTENSYGTAAGNGQGEADRDYTGSNATGEGEEKQESGTPGGSYRAADAGKTYAYRTASAGETGQNVKGEYKGAYRTAQSTSGRYGADTRFEEFLNRNEERFDRFVERNAERFERRAERFEKHAERVEETLNGMENKTGTYSAKQVKQEKKTKQKKREGKDPGKRAKVWARLFLFFGACFLIGGLGAITDKFAWASFATLLPDILLASIGAAMLIAGLVFRKRKLLNRKYAAIIGNREWVAIEQIANALSVSEKRCERELQSLIDDGYFGSSAYIDRTRRVFYRSSDIAEIHDENARDAKEFRAKKEEPRSESLTEHEAIIREIRRLNDDIDDVEVSERIDKIEALTDNIYRLIEEHPEKKAQVSTFMDYYLPTTLKLLSAYATFEDQAATGENIQQAKRNIESILDTLVAGFSQQLDKLFEADAMDISGDIRVLEQMMERDGLTRGKGDIHAYGVRAKDAGTEGQAATASEHAGAKGTAGAGGTAAQTAPMPEEDKIELKL